MSKKQSSDIKLPQIKHRKSGLRKQGKRWVALYYEGDKLRTWNTTETSLNRAINQRDWFHKKHLDAGASYKGGVKPSLKDAIENPDGNACIYEKTTYVVIVDGTTVITTTNKDKAKSERDAFINKHYRS